MSGLQVCNKQVTCTVQKPVKCANNLLGLQVWTKQDTYTV